MTIIVNIIIIIIQLYFMATPNIEVSQQDSSWLVFLSIIK